MLTRVDGMIPDIGATFIDVFDEDGQLTAIIQPSSAPSIFPTAS